VGRRHRERAALPSARVANFGRVAAVVRRAPGVHALGAARSDVDRPPTGELGAQYWPRRAAAMYISVSRLRVDAAKADELVAAFRQRSHLVDGTDGFVDLQVWRSDRDAEEVWMVSRWRERRCFDYMRSEEHARSHARIPEDLDAAISLQRLEHMHTFEVVAE